MRNFNIQSTIHFSRLVHVCNVFRIHAATCMLWDHPAVSTKIFGRTCETGTDVTACIGELIVRVAAPITQNMLQRAERAVLYAYLYTFGELPPLNSSTPQRSSNANPPTDDIAWANEGLGVDVEITQRPH